MRSLASLSQLEGRKALIAGGAGHVGRAAAEALIELGASVALIDRNESVLEYASSLSAKAAFVCDLADEDELRRTVRSVIERLGGLDILVHSAAYVGTTTSPGWAVPFSEQTVQAWDAAFRVNVTAGFISVQEARAALSASGNGSIVFIGSIYASLAPDFRLYEDTAMANPAGYGSSKGALLQLMRHCSTLLAPQVRVNSISPGGIQRGQPAAFVDRYERKVPLGRMATEEDVKGAIAFLSSDLSAYVTGHDLVLDGGWGVW
jgi:NAD(P)-dependent dehydrogenase (short-subunit alcohol dehydrogenase family)